MIYIAIIIIGFILDRITKIYATNNFIENPYHGVLFNFTYLENRGAAFGILQDKRILFLLLTIVVVIGLVVYFLRTYKTNHKMLNIAYAMIISGAIGNFYDRLVQGYVVDFLEFTFFNFPIFNIADILVTGGALLLIIHMLFLEEKEASK